MSKIPFEILILMMVLNLLNNGSTRFFRFNDYTSLEICSGWLSCGLIFEKSKADMFDKSDLSSFYRGNSIGLLICL